MPDNPQDPQGQYLGDGVYASFDGYQIWLETQRSSGIDRIALEPAVYHALVQYQARIVEEASRALSQTKPA